MLRNRHSVFYTMRACRCEKCDSHTSVQKDATTQQPLAKKHGCSLAFQFECNQCEHIQELKTTPPSTQTDAEHVVRGGNSPEPVQCDFQVTVAKDLVKKVGCASEHVPECFSNHGWMVLGSQTSGGAHCAICNRSAKCTCKCGIHVCGARSGRQCIFQHMAAVLKERSA